MKRALVICLSLAALACAVPATGTAGGGPNGPSFGSGKYPRESRALGFCNVFANSVPKYRSCIISHALQLILQTHDPADELPRIDLYVHSVSGYLENHCHILMHTVGREYAAKVHVTLENLLNYLPKSNDPNCSAGFGHGLLIHLGPQIKKIGPKGAAAECAKAPTRYERYSCIHGLGHAYARIFIDAIAPALQMCDQLGTGNATDCAQGVYHDYWIAVSGLDAAHAPPGSILDPRTLCDAQPKQFVLPCWYRALLEHPPEHALTNAKAIDAECNGLSGLDRSGCIVGSSLITSDDPYTQMQTCATMDSTDAASCVRGVVSSALLNQPLSSQIQLIQGCAVYPHAAQHACYGWLGKALNVVDNGTFGKRGCTRLRYSATRNTCTAGAKSYEGPLGTFS
ncbi:MAG TPA: hypothetical protein VLJ76_01545 [Gaiellaceae bacterium]|nr:hypothetical protein [Gaiellaceae bacterium]